MKFSILNPGQGRLAVRDSGRGLVQLLPGRSDDFDLPLSLARYYKGAGASVTPDPDSDSVKADSSAPGPRDLADLTAEERAKIAADEGIDLGDLDPGSDDAVATIREFRRIWGLGTDAEVRAQYGDVDLSEAKTKRDAVNAIIKARGVSPAG